MSTSSERVEYPALNEGVESMPSKERAARMVEVNLGYAQCFMDGDFEGMLDYLIDVPVFEHYPMGIRITGRAAVLERSRRLHPSAVQNDSRTAGDTHVITASTAGSDVLIHEFNNVFDLPDGTRTRCYMLAVVPFVGDKMVGENVYTDHRVADWWDSLFGEDYLEIPGVELL